MSATIKDVAERAGVSPATVSYVLNQSAPVSDRTRERVLKAVAELDYRPSYQGRSLRGRHSRTIGVVIPPEPDQVETLLPSPLLAGVAAAIAAAGYHLLICSTEPNDERELYRDLIATGRVDGLIVLAPQRNDPRLIQLAELQLPHTCLGRPPRWSAAPAAGRDLRAGALRAVGYLAHQGHQRIALIQEVSDRADALDWYIGYRRALRGAGIPFRSELVIEGGPGIGSGYSAMETLLSHSEPPTAVLACSEELTFGALAAAADAGLSVGSDLALIASGDSLAAVSAQPPLTTLRWPDRAIGYALGELIIAAIAGTAVRRFVAFIPQLMVRASTAASG
ncbi:MAG: LacI family transcriptional regulator [Herpetosiphonaceae bacterium]|nr:MAG: LacI family transcriptional regulator [Herpetosiphonaceae bacterium]